METPGFQSSREYPLTPDSSTGNKTSRRAKRPMPDGLKDDRYWEKRKRNNEAAKKSREAKRQQEYSIRERMLICEQENAMLRQELARLRADRDATRLALASEGHSVPGYNSTDQSSAPSGALSENTSHGVVDYNSDPSTAHGAKLPPMQSFQPQNQDSNYDTRDNHGQAPSFYTPPPFQYPPGAFGFYVAAYGQTYQHRYPVPMPMTENVSNNCLTPVNVPERLADLPRAEARTPSAVSGQDSQEMTKTTSDNLKEIKAENADLKTKLRDLEQAVSYMRDMSQYRRQREENQNSGKSGDEEDR